MRFRAFFVIALATVAAPSAFSAGKPVPKTDPKGDVNAAPARPETPHSKTEERAKFHPKVLGMDSKTRLQGFERRLAMERESPFSALRFRNVGPEIQGGRVVDLEVPLDRPDTLLVAFASGGLWKTTNQGGSWEPLFEREAAMTLGAIAVGDREGKVLWAGTGESNSSRSSYAGTGVYKSTDSGATWTNTGLRDSHHIGRIVVDAKRPNTVYVASIGPLYSAGGERGVYKTTDGGQTWARSLFVDDKTGAIDLVSDPTRPEVLYAAMWERDRKAWNFLESGPASGIYKTTDAGASWQRLGGGFPEGATVGRIGLAVAASHPSTLYAVLDNQALRPESEPLDEETPPGELTPRRLRGLTKDQFLKIDNPVLGRFLKAYDFPKDLKPDALKSDVKAGKVTLADLDAYLADANRSLFESRILGAELYRSDDAGATWRKTHEKRLDKVVYTYGYYFGRVFVASDDPEHVFAAGLPMIASKDGGKTFRGVDRQGVHGDHHALKFHPSSPRQVFMGNDGGLNFSWDGGLTWRKINNLPVGQFTTIAVDDAEPYNIVGGLQDNGVLRGPSTYVAGKTDPGAWKAIYGGDGSCVQIDPKDRNVIYAASQFGFASRLDVKAGTRERVRPRPALKEKPLRYNWVAPFLLSPHSRNILYFGTNRLFRSFDRGETWTAISPDLTSDREQGDVPFGTATSIAESPKTFGVLYVGTDEGRLWGSRDGGVTWKDLSKGLAKDRWVTRVVASAFDEGTVFVSQNGYRQDDFLPYVFRSTDFGATWQSIAKGLPEEPINTVREDPKAKHLLYIGTDLGAFVSLDRGDTWSALTGGLPHVPVHDLAVQPREGDVVLATHGRSVYVADAAPLRKLTDEVRKKPLFAFSIKKTKWERDRGYGDHPFLNWNEIPEIVRIAWWAGPETSGDTTITLRDANGNPWKTLTTKTAPGFNVVEYDVTAEPGLADKAEEAARANDAERTKANRELEERLRPKPAEDAPKEASAKARDKAADGAAEEPGASDSKPKPTEAEAAELVKLLADPLLETRKRYLGPGTYKVEIAVKDQKATTELEVKKPKDGEDEGDDKDDSGPDPVD